ncbi:MAG: 50S ribosomal protein L21 [Deltaproteobacteria bacterium]|nr:50S ribosomal protein L21 [Deltaproteobacteria bacterium]
MYAVIRTGGKQYKVEEGTSLSVEKLDGNPGDKVDLTDVLFVGGTDSPKVGRPVVDGAVVTAEILRQDRSAKVVVYKRKRRKGFHKERGHRQPFTSLKVLSIKG